MGEVLGGWGLGHGDVGEMCKGGRSLPSPAAARVTGRTHVAAIDPARCPHCPQTSQPASTAQPDQPDPRDMPPSQILASPSQPCQAIASEWWSDLWLSRIIKQFILSLISHLSQILVTLHPDFLATQNQRQIRPVNPTKLRNKLK